MLYSFNRQRPEIHTEAFIAPSADIIGQVKIESEASVWFNCTVRGDHQSIHIGRGSNIQDNSVLHIAAEKLPVIIEDNVTIGHRCTVHAATLKSHAFIGMGATVMDGAVVNSYGFVAAGALVVPGFEVPERTLVAGVPARVIRDVKDAEIEMIENTAALYRSNAREFNEKLKLIGPEK